MATISWKRTQSAPFLIPQAGSVAESAVTTPDVLVTPESLVFYVGAVSGGVERIIRFRLLPQDLMSRKSIKVPASAQVVLDTGPYEFNRFHVFDPACIHWKNEVYLYYSAVGTQPDCIGLATSPDGISFTKCEKPILEGRSPEIVCRKDRLYLFYANKLPGMGYAIFCAESEDGLIFSQEVLEPVLVNGKPDDWDGYEVTTPRIFEWKNVFYMIYAGCQSSERKDIPDAFGLARSEDLSRWEKYPHNPIFTLGEQNNWDDGALWFGTVFEWEKTFYLIYEGGRLNDVTNQSPALTNIGLACLTTNDFDELIKNWR